MGLMYEGRKNRNEERERRGRGRERESEEEEKAKTAVKSAVPELTSRLVISCCLDD